MGCEGGGDHRCKLRVNWRQSESCEQICLGIDNACGGNELNLSNHAQGMITLEQSISAR